jgi:transcriptional regulator with XRE-family HTH domain
VLIHDLLRQARQDAGLTQRQLAARAGLGQPALSRYETGVVAPSLATVDRILAATGQELDGSLVRRHHDLDREVARLGQLDAFARLTEVGLRVPYVLGCFQRAASPVVVAGAWAAAVHGVPRDHDTGRLLVLDTDDDRRAAAAALAAAYASLVLDGEARALDVRPGTLVRHPQATWRVGWVPDFLVEVTGRLPEHETITLDDATLRVVPGPSLGAADGVRPLALERWRTRPTSSPPKKRPT